jgi:hypothetical protein
VEAFTFGWQGENSKPINFQNKQNNLESIHRYWVITGKTYSKSAVVRPTNGPLASSFMVEEDDDEEEEGDDDSNESRTRKRDFIKDFFTTPSTTGADSRQRVKTKFEDFFGGMPGVGEILGDSPEDDDNDVSSRGTPRKPKQDPAWFEEEKKRIMDR